MKKKSEARRRAILDAAATVFRNTGFDGASMAQIAELLGYSKATLYVYFSSKEELLYEVLMEAADAQSNATYLALDPSSEDIEAVLHRFGAQMMKLMYSKEIMSIRRLLLAEVGRRSDLGKRCYDVGPAKAAEVVATYLDRAMDGGKLRRADAMVACLHLRALLEAELVDGFLFGDALALPPATIEEATKRAVEAFLRAYAPSN